MGLVFAIVLVIPSVYLLVQILSLICFLSSEEQVEEWKREHIFPRMRLYYDSVRGYYSEYS
jgi:hypothetical protein